LNSAEISAIYGQHVAHPKSFRSRNNGGVRKPEVEISVRLDESQTS
jgi:hypothetical protein